MEFILEAFFEFIFEIILEGGMEVGTNKKYSRWIRYPLLLLTCTVYAGLIALLVFVGFLVLKDGLWRAIVMWVLALSFIIATIWVIYKEFKIYKKKRSKLK